MTALPSFIFPPTKRIKFQAIELFLRAVRRSRSFRRPRMFRVRLDGLDDQVEFVGAVDFPRYAVIAVWRDLLGFGEVVQAIDPVRGVISHEKHDTGAIFRPRDQGKMIGAEVKHVLDRKGRKPGPAVSAVEGLPGGLLRAGYHHSAALS